MISGGVCTLASFFFLVFQMKSVGYNQADGSLFLQTDTARPELQNGDVMIKVVAAGVNRLDLIQAAGKYPPPPGESNILGVEVSGKVVEVTPLAAEKSAIKVGDQVMALVGGGGYAEFCRAPYQVVMKVPSGISLTHAAGIPEVFLTAYQALVTNARMKDGETVLIHAGASGVGLAATQLAKVLFKDTKVIVTAGSDKKLQVCREYGADVAINYKSQDFAAEVLSATADQGADIILDFVGAPYWEKHGKCVAMDGRIVHLGFLGGSVLSSANLVAELRKRVTHIFSTLRSRSLQYRQQLIKDFSEQALHSFVTSELRVPIDSSFSLEEASKAHDRMRDNKNIGKILITLNS